MSDLLCLFLKLAAWRHLSVRHLTLELPGSQVRFGVWLVGQGGEVQGHS